jgi:hypothetical protein
MQGIETRLKTIQVNGQNMRTAPYLPDQVNPPMAVVGVPPIPRYHGTFTHGKFELDVPVIVLVSKVVDRIDQATLAAFADIDGTLSVHKAIEGDRTLGGAVDDCIVVSFRPLGNEEVGAIGYYGGEFTLHVVAAGS